MIADHVTQNHLQVFLERRTISILHRFQQIIEDTIILRRCQVFQDFITEDAANFFIRDRQIIFFPVIFFVIHDGHTLEIPCSEHDIIEIRTMLLDVRIDKRFLQPRADRLSFHEIHQVERPFPVQLLEHRLQDAVARCPHPVFSRLARVGEIIVDRPWVVDVHAVDVVAVVPCGNLRELVLVPEVARKLRHIFPRISASIRIAAGDDGGNAQIVEPAENAFLRDAQHTREDSEIKRRIRLECMRKQIAIKTDGFFIKAMRPRILDGSVILINEQHSLPPIVAFQELAEQVECLVQDLRRSIPL